MVIVTVAAAQHHHYDPFHGSGCTCAKFCNYQCSINATKPQNLTVYRMTPYGVWNVDMKDTGDVKGDTSFVISRKTSSYDCKKDPNQWFCNTVTQAARYPLVHSNNFRLHLVISLSLCSSRATIRTAPM